LRVDMMCCSRFEIRIVNFLPWVDKIEKDRTGRLYPFTKTNQTN
jgi:hypothetical protein